MKINYKTSVENFLYSAGFLAFPFAVHAEEVISFEESCNYIVSFMEVAQVDSYCEYLGAIVRPVLESRVTTRIFLGNFTEQQLYDVVEQEVFLASDIERERIKGANPYSNAGSPLGIVYSQYDVPDTSQLIENYKTMAVSFVRSRGYSCNGDENPSDCEKRTQPETTCSVNYHAFPISNWQLLELSDADYLREDGYKEAGISAFETRIFDRSFITIIHSSEGSSQNVEVRQFVGNPSNTPTPWALILEEVCDSFSRTVDWAALQDVFDQPEFGYEAEYRNSYGEPIYSVRKSRDISDLANDPECLRALERAREEGSR